MACFWAAGPVHRFQTNYLAVQSSSLMICSNTGDSDSV